MPKIIRYKYKIYKRFELDIWGVYRNNPIYNNKITNFLQMVYKEKFDKSKKRLQRFIYRVDIVNPGRSLKKLKWKFVSFQLIRLFYRGMNPSKFNFFINKSTDLDGYWVLNFLLLLESRISTILYRLNWVSNILYVKQFLLHGNVFVNSKLVYSTNYLVRLTEILAPSFASKSNLIAYLKERLNFNLVYFCYPRYLWVNNKLMIAMIYKLPEIKDISYPISLDLYRFLDTK